MPGPFNFSKINNDAARHAKGQVLVLLNDDTEVITPDWLEELVSHAMRDGIGAVGAKLLYPDNSVQHGGVILGVGGIAAHAHRFLPHDAPGHMNLAVSIQAIAAVTGACLAVRREHFEAVGGLDESLAVAFNDIDFCLRLRQTGLRNVFTPWAQLYHHESLSRGLDDSDAKRRVYQQEKLLMQERWGGLMNERDT
jgi:GT2 family glycosyltransferase